MISNADMQRRKKAAIALIRLQREQGPPSVSNGIRAVPLVATTDGMAQWLEKLENTSQLGAAAQLFAVASSMPDNAGPRSEAWDNVGSAMLHEGDHAALPLLKELYATNPLECIHGLDSLGSGWSLLHKVMRRL
jgi:hypothetical protein